MWTWFLLMIHTWIIAVVIWWASRNTYLHTESLYFDDAIVLLAVFKCIARLCFYSAFLLYKLDFILLWNFNTIRFTRFIFVNSVIVYSNIRCNDLS